MMNKRLDKKGMKKALEMFYDKYLELSISWKKETRAVCEDYVANIGSDFESKLQDIDHRYMKKFDRVDREMERAGYSRYINVVYNAARDNMRELVL